MQLTTRQLVTIAIFGALWGAVEANLGAVLKALHLPLNGLILAAIGLSLALTGRFFVPRRGATLFIGVIATLLKLFSIGGVVVGPMIGILGEALIAELVLSAFARNGGLSPARFLAAGALATLWPLVQPFVTGALLFGRNMVDVWLDLIALGSRALGLEGSAAVTILLLLTLAHLLAGATAGWLAWTAGHELAARLGTTHFPLDLDPA